MAVLKGVLPQTSPLLTETKPCMNHSITKVGKTTKASSPTINLCHWLLWTMALSATSSLSWSISRDGDSPTSLGSLCQCITTPSVKKFFLISNLNLPWLGNLTTKAVAPFACSNGTRELIAIVWTTLRHSKHQGGYATNNCYSSQGFREASWGSYWSE